MSRYYDDLSGDSSDGCNSSEESDVEGDTFQGAERTCTTTTSNLHDRIILHADVDCFYSQVEMIERNIADQNRPVAVGQKHIIATCNYAARKAGITKLMGREAAQIRCPHLLIVDGSDLERYRVHARRIYESFRRHCKRLLPASVTCKGHMDEMMADLSSSIRPPSTAEAVYTNTARIPEDIFVYGEQEDAGVVVLTEDQSGAQTFVQNRCRNSVRNSDPESMHRLLAAATVVLNIRQAMYEETGFNVTMGLSVNPLLAKLASGLKKPGKVNVLPPNHRSSLVESMPLRKIPGIGSRTMKALKPCLIARHGNNQMSWTCGDLLQVPHRDLIQCLETLNAPEKSAKQCDVLLKLCRGVDESCIVDDQGGAQKTLSIENSFKRGSLITKQKVLTVMDDLYKRLPRLLNDRTKWSSNKMKAYPTTLRLTVRFVVKMADGRTTAKVQSQQMSFDGKALVEEQDVTKQKLMVRRFVAPILQSMVLSLNAFNISRINIGLTNFQDIPASSRSKTDQTKTSEAISALSHVPTKRSQNASLKRPPVAAAATVTKSKKSPATNQTSVKQRTVEGNSWLERDQPALFSSYPTTTADPIDPSVLAALPAELTKGLHSTKPSSPPKRKQKIDHYFSPKK